MAPGNPNSYGKRSWRDAPRAAGSPQRAGSKAPLRAALAIVTLALLAGLIWLLWIPVQPEPPTHFVAITTGPSDFFSVPPILFEQETLAPLQQISDPASTLRYVDGAPAQRGGGIQAIQSLLADQRIDADDRLVVYVSAHGVSDDGVAYVLRPGYDLLEPAANRYPVADLMHAVSQSGAATKLLVLDCSKLATHPRLGMAVNEFNGLVEQLARELDDPDMWVMTAAAGPQTSPLGLAERRSPLGGALVDAMLGAAGDDAARVDMDRDLTLQEIDALVVQHCARARTATPRPLLIPCSADPPGGQGERVVFRIPNPEPAAEQQGEQEPGDHQQLAGGDQQSLAKQPSGEGKAAGENKADAPRDSNAEEPTVGANASAPGDSTPTGGAEPAANNLAANERAESNENRGDSAGASPSERAHELLPPMLMAWRLRDQLDRDPSIDGFEVLPIDCAPHDWNELTAVLTALHLSQLGLPAEGDLDRQIQRHQQGLQRLAEDRFAGRLNTGTVADRVAQELADYERSAALASLASGAIPERYGRALLDFRRAVYRTGQLVQWHAAETASLGAGAAGAAEINMLLDRLFAMDRRLAELERTPLSSWQDGQARAVLQHIEPVRAQIRAVDQVIDGMVAAAAGDDPVALRRAETLLATSVATAAQRAALLAALEDSDVGGDATPETLGRLADGKALAEHLRLEVRLLQLVDPQARESALLSDFLSGALPLDLSSEQAVRQVRALGDALGDWYAQLPQRLAGASRPGDDAEFQRAAEKMVAVLHCRDARSLPRRVAGTQVASRIDPPRSLSVVPPSVVALSTEAWTPIPWAVERQNISIQRARVVLESFDSGAVEVRFAGAEDPARVRDSHPISPDEVDRFTLQVRAKTDQQGSAAARTKPIRVTFTFSTDDGERVESSSADVRVPLPSRIDLFARCVSPSVPQDVHGEDGLILRPYPNRTTTFQFELANRSEDAKNLRVEFLAVPSPDDLSPRRGELGWPPGRLFDLDDRPYELLADWVSARSSAAPVLAQATISLPPDGEARPLVLRPPGSEKPAPGDEPADGESAGDGPAAAPADPPAVAATPVTRGLICRITNADRPSQQWIKWIEIVPLRPASYVDVRAQYSDANREIRFGIRPIDLNGDRRADFPPGAADQPVSVAVRGDGAILPVGNVVQTELGGGARDAELIIRATDQARGRNQIVQLQIDGYPRADIWRVDFEAGTVDRVRNRQWLEIESLGMSGDARTPGRLYARQIEAADPPIDPEIWPEAKRLGPDSLCAFDISRGSRSMQLKLQVDAPLDAFNAIGGGDGIVIVWHNDAADTNWNEGREALKLYGDREIRTELLELTEAGGIAVSAAVSDFTLPLAPPGVNDRTMQLGARMSVEGSRSAGDSVRVAFDNAAPDVRASLARSTVEAGTARMPITVTVDDLSGVSRIDVWTYPEQELPPGADELDPKKATSFVPKLQYDQSVLNPLPPLSIPAPQKPGRYAVVVQVTDGSGQRRTTLRDPARLTVVEPKPSPDELGPLVASLEGTVLYASGRPVAGVKVTLNEKPQFSASTDGQGRFRINRVEAGAYTLLVTGRVNGRPVVGEHEVTLEKRDDFKGHVVQAEWQLSKPPDE